MSGSRRPRAIAGWNGAPEVYVRNCLTERTAATRSAGPVTQPIFHPVIENVLPADPIDKVRERMPGSVAIGDVRPLVRHVLVDLVHDDDEVPCSTASSATALSSARDSTAPVGLCGVLSRMTRVRGVTARAQARRRRARTSGAAA